MVRCWRRERFPWAGLGTKLQVYLSALSPEIIFMDKVLVLYLSASRATIYLDDEQDKDRQHRDAHHDGVFGEEGKDRHGEQGNGGEQCA